MVVPPDQPVTLQREQQPATVATLSLLIRVVGAETDSAATTPPS